MHKFLVYVPFVFSVGVIMKHVWPRLSWCREHRTVILFYADLVSYVFLERFTIREFGNKCYHLQLYSYLPREPAKFGEHNFLADISVVMHFREKIKNPKR